MLSRSEARAELWRRGNLRWKLLAHQPRLYDFLEPNPVRPGEPLIRVVNSSRRLGKSTVGLIRSTERCIRKPRAMVRYAAATGKELRKITIPIMRKLCEDAPEEVRPRWLQFDHVFLFPNGSEMHMAGADNGNADALRGTESDLNLVEEAGHCDDLDYLVRDVLLPQTLTTLAPTFLIGTPPRTPAHDFSAFAAEAEARNVYLRMTIDENTSIPAPVRAAYAQEAGGEDSTTWQREYLCQFVVDEETAVVPEWSKDGRAGRIVQPAPPITWEQPVVAMDVGFEDFHAILYGYWHFGLAKLVIQAEDVLQRATTDRIAAAIKAKEKSLWTSRRGSTNPARWSDVDPRLIADLCELHKLSVDATAKDDLEAQVNALRLLVKEEKIIVDPSCVALRRQLSTAVWNKARTTFERTKLEGHFDTVAALIYMLRNVDRYTNPYPSLPEGVTDATHWIHSQRGGDSSTEAKVFNGIFGR